MSDAYCPTCREVSLLKRNGECVWCDTPIRTSSAPPKAVRANAGIPVNMLDDVIEEAKRLYDTGLSLRQCAERLVDRTEYALAKSMAMGLSTAFRHRGWPVRGRIEQTVITSTKHGRARRYHRDPAYQRERKLATGETRGVMCKGVRQNYPNKGAPCKRAALRDSEYCRHHDPRLAEEIRAHLVEARKKAVAA